MDAILLDLSENKLFGAVWVLAITHLLSCLVVPARVG